jgi:hypothetical protein
MNENRFWALIESAWQCVGGKSIERQRLATHSLLEEEAESLQESLEEVIPTLEESLGQLSAEDLLAFDRILEQKLYDIDRKEIQAYTDGSDDGFLYARGFIVAVGKAYYDAVNENPQIALMDLECEEMCYLPLHLYQDRFGDVPSSSISRETCSNTKGWQK